MDHDFCLDFWKGLKTNHGSLNLNLYRGVINLTTKNVNVKIGEMKTNSGLIKNLEVSIGKVVNDNYTEPMGPTPMPSMTTLRDWDMKLLKQVQALLHARL